MTSSYYPRKIRYVKTGGKIQHLMSVPRPIAEKCKHELFTCALDDDGRIVFTPIPQEKSDAA